jgi:hypothetical protein
MKSKLKPAVGKWIIVEMEAWEQDFVSMEAMDICSQETPLLQDSGQGHLVRCFLHQ